jgi:hypothetical protein
MGQSLGQQPELRFPVAGPSISRIVLLLEGEA